MSNTVQETTAEGVAVIGLWGRFPGADGVEQFWQNLRDGVESVSFFTDEELRAAGVDPSRLDSNHVRAKGVLAGVELFDAAFFGINPREAEIIDPQHRIFLEGAWAALENAGYNPEKYEGSVGVYGGPNVNSYFLHNLFSNLDVLRQYGLFETTIRSRPDLLTTQVSYKLNLKGPSMSVQTACSTSLVAVHVACQGLLNGECDMALAGGVSVSLPQTSGYVYQEGGILSPDGHCRPFDAMAQGTVFGNGAAMVVLKRLADALADGDNVLAVIKGSAVNNDGSLKVGLTAPGLDGQAAVITEAQLVAGVEPDEISYVEAHGTATALGDPVEVAALTQAFRSRTQRRRFCALGSVKSNVGHLDTAAGVAGLIKTVLALHHKQLPPSLHYTAPNPRIEFDETPFFVNAELRAWESAMGPRRAGVSSFGIGGTNAHVIVEEAPEPAQADDAGRARQLLLLSARSAAALEAATGNLSAHLEAHPEQELADVAYTLQVGRKGFAHRRALVCASREEALEALAGRSQHGVLTAHVEGQRPRVVFLFPGQGAQRVGMARELYETEEVFRTEFDRCCEVLKAEAGWDLRAVLFDGDEDDAAQTAELLAQTEVTQPALFAVEYALAGLWRAWGVEPDAMLGHSVGEYVAACVAGVMTVEDAMRLVAARGRLMGAQPAGAMLAVGLGEPAVLERIAAEGAGGALWLAAVNGEQACVVAGTHEAVAKWEEKLSGEGVLARRLKTSHAFHSGLMDGALAEFGAAVRGVELKSPRAAYVSNVTGRWATAGEATDPEYWVRHLRQTVRFDDGLAEILEEENVLLLEVGPGNTLARLAGTHRKFKSSHVVVATLGDAKRQDSEATATLDALGRVWLAGVEVDWVGYYGAERRRRLPLPTYPFERQRFWIDAQPQAGQAGARAASTQRKTDIADWFYVPTWRQSPLMPTADEAESRLTKWLLFGDEGGLWVSLTESLKRRGHETFVVVAGERFAARGEGVYEIDPRRAEDYDALFEALGGGDGAPEQIAHLWSLGADERGASSIEACGRAQERGFYSLLLLAQALGKLNLGRACRLNVVSEGVYDVTGGESLRPENATVVGPCKVIPKEYQHVGCRHFDIERPAAGSAAETRLVAQLTDEFEAETSETPVALRGRHRWAQSFEPLRLEASSREGARLREGGVYLITGGLGTIGLALAEHLARETRGKLVLVNRSPFPAREEWAARLAEGDAAADKIKKIMTLEESGAEVLVVSADVADEEAMRAALALAEGRFGKINGVVHSAGVAGGGMIQLKTAAAVAEVFAPKVYGALVLEELLKERGLDFFVLCSSALAVVGPLGQIDYCAANSFLDAFAHAHASRRGVPTVSVNWDAWAGAGMAVEARPAAPAAVNAKTTHANGDGATATHEGEPFAHPLFERRVVEPGGATAFVTRLGGAAEWMLDEHRIMGRRVLPGTAYLEMARAAFREAVPSAAAAELRDVMFVSPLAVGDGEQAEVRTVVEKNGSGWKFRVVSRPAAGQGSAGAWREHAAGRVYDAAAESPRTLDLEAIARACDDRSAEPARRDEAREGHMAFGPRWESLKRVSVGAGELLGLLELPAEFAAELDAFELHPALMDVATGVAARRIEEGFYLPLSYGRVRTSGPLPAKVFAHVRERARTGGGRETIAFDVALCDAAGAVRVEVEEFILRRVDGTVAAQSQTAQAKSAAHDAASQDGEARGASREVNSIPGGISVGEGAEAFGRVLGATHLPQVVVAPRDLQSLVERSEAFSQAALLEQPAEQQTPKRHYPRPALQTAYVAPGNEIEERLADIWQNLLGIERVGTRDNFFELGGHSLLTLQMVSRLRDAFQIELPLRDLFEIQTVAELAAAVEEHIMNKIIERISGLTDEEARLVLQETPGLLS